MMSGRRAARAVLLDPNGHVLLLRGRDPFAARRIDWWEIPGGGIDPGETSADAARRELHEEAGIADVEIGPCVWVQQARFTFAGMRFDQWEEIHVAWCGTVAPRWEPQGLEAIEALAFSGHRWWQPDQVTASDERFLPSALRSHVLDLAEGRLPASPIDISHLPAEIPASD